MRIFYFVAILTIAMGAHADNCLPKFEIADKQIMCATDSDCTLVGDACRSCGSPSVANIKFKKEIELKDQRNRESKQCVLACEACSQKRYIVQCKDKRCQATAKQP